MEACIENYSKGPMVLEYVRFDAAPPLTAVSIDIRDVLLTDFMSDNPLGSYIDQLQVCPVVDASAVTASQLSSAYSNQHSCTGKVPRQDSATAKLCKKHMDNACQSTNEEQAKRHVFSSIG